MSSASESSPDAILNGPSSVTRRPPAETGAGATSTSREEQGDYEILEELGRGGTQRR